MPPGFDIRTFECITCDDVKVATGTNMWVELIPEGYDRQVSYIGQNTYRSPISTGIKKLVTLSNFVQCDGSCLAQIILFKFWRI